MPHINDVPPTPEWVFAFSGRVDGQTLERHGLAGPQVANALDQQSSEIAADIEAELRRRLDAEFHVHIEFADGSVTWLGVIDGTLTWAANIGGTIGLVQLLAMVVSRAVRTHMPAPLPRLTTNVTVVRAPQQQTVVARPAHGPGAGAVVSRADVLLLTNIAILVLLAFILGLLIGR